MPVQKIAAPAATTSTSLFTEADSVPAPAAAASANSVTPIANAPAAPADRVAPVAPVASAPPNPVAPIASAPTEPVAPIVIAPASPVTRSAAPIAAASAAPVAAVPAQKRDISAKDPSISIAPILPNTTSNLTEKKPSTSSAPPPNENELKKALEKIGKLEKELNELKQEGLRARNGRKLPSTVQPLDAVHQHLAALETPRPTEGYPPQVVIGVAVLVFIVTYLFF